MALKLIDLLKKFGGSIEANVPVLQQLANEIGGQIQKYRKEGKTRRGEGPGDGFAKLRRRFSAEHEPAAERANSSHRPVADRRGELSPSPASSRPPNDLSFSQKRFGRRELGGEAAWREPGTWAPR